MTDTTDLQTKEATMSETQELAAESTALVAVKAALPTIIAADNEDILGRLARELAGFKPDISTETGRREIASKARKAAVAKMDLIRLAGTLKADHQKVLKGIIAEEKVITERMDGLRDSIRAPLTEFEQREERRVQAHNAALAEVASFAVIPPDWQSDSIQTRIGELDTSDLLSRDWEEFRERAREAAAIALNALNQALAAAVKREAEAAELARLRAEAAERERQDALRLQAEREAEIARQAAERARIAAEEDAARQAREVEDAAQREREAAEAERQRIIREAAEREEAAARAAQTERDAAAGRERLAAEALANAERERVEALRQAAREKADAEDRARMFAARAEADRIAAAEQAERDRLAAVEAERAHARREQAEAEAEAQRRAANKAHLKQVNGEVLADVLKAAAPAIIAEDAAKAIVIALAKGLIRHCKLEY